MATLKAGQVVQWTKPGDPTAGTTGVVRKVSVTQVVIAWDDGVVSSFAPSGERIKHVRLVRG